MACYILFYEGKSSLWSEPLQKAYNKPSLHLQTHQIHIFTIYNLHI